MVCGGVKAPGHHPVQGRDLEPDVLGLDNPCAERVEREKDPIEMIGVISRDRDLNVARIVLLFANPELLDLELAAHAHYLVKRLCERERIYQVPFHLYVAGFAHCDQPL